MIYTRRESLKKKGAGKLERNQSVFAGKGSHQLKQLSVNLNLWEFFLGHIYIFQSFFFGGGETKHNKYYYCLFLYFYICELFYCYTCRVGLSNKTKVHSFLYEMGYADIKTKICTDELYSVHSVNNFYLYIHHANFGQFKAKLVL